MHIIYPTRDSNFYDHINSNLSPHQTVLDSQHTMVLISPIFEPSSHTSSLPIAPVITNTPLNLSFLTPLFLNHLYHPFLINPHSTTLLVATNHLLTLKIMWLITPPYSFLWRPFRGPCSAHAIHYISMFFIHAYLLDINILFLIYFFL